MRTLILALTLLAGSPLAHADTDLPQKDDMLEAAAPTALRESTPDAMFGGQAAQIGWIKKGESVRVLETRQYLSIFGVEIWIEVQKLDDAAVHGWVLDGMGKDIVKGKSALSITQTAASLHPKAPPEPVDPREAAASAAAKEGDHLVEDILN
ncbi:MAG: hypothetical protein ACXWR1_12740 [Bdellovibrionota bacterium]